MTAPRKLWEPSPAAVASSRLEDLSRRISEETGVSIQSYQDLHQWSIDNLGSFWSHVWDEAGFIGDKGDIFYREGADFISSEFFPNANLNVAENLLAKGDDSHPAIVSISEDGARREISWAELRRDVAAVANALSSHGVVAGDRVVAWAPNVVEVVIYALGALSIGAIVSTASPDFAPSAVLDRFGQIQPKVLLACIRYSYAGKVFDCREKLNDIVASLPTLSAVIVIEDSPADYINFADWVRPFSNAQLVFKRFPFNHPGFILFSSGTTGKPKCIVHSGAGILLKDTSEYMYHVDIRKNDRVFYFTTCGWMMWNWLFGTLATGATVILYDGSPAFPNHDRLFSLASDEKLTFLGVSAKFLDSTRKAGLSPIDSYDLTNLRTIGSTGSVLSPESFDYVYEHIKGDVHLLSMSGGTDICGCFLSGIPTNPVFRGELQGACLGMSVEVYDASGKRTPSDEKGELVCTLPFPSKPIGFWGDHGYQKYRAAYFEGFPGVWTHGDFAAKSATGGFTLFGRSDATLNCKGVRIGTAEIYRVVENFEWIEEAAAVSQDWEGDTRVILFVKTKPGFDLSEIAIKEIKEALRVNASPRHVPDKIIAVPELPHTKSGKLVELAIGDLINRREVRNTDALANPESLEWFRDIPELAS